MIKTLTPYYVDVPLTNPASLVVCTSYTVKIYIWAGNKNAVPSVASYEKTKVNAANSNGVDEINISRLINDFIDFDCTPSFVTSLEDSNNQVWVRFFVTYDDQPSLPQLQFVELAVRGYGYFMEGENPTTPTNKVLLEGTEFKVNRNGLFVLPIELDETPPATPSITIDSMVDIGGGEFELYFSYVGTYTSMQLLIHQIGEPIDLLFDYESPVSPLVLSVAMPEDPTDFEFTLSGFDIISATNVDSNIFELTLP